MTAALACGLALTIPSMTTALNYLEQDETPKPCQESRAPVLCQTQQHRLEVWRLQRTMSLPLTRTTYSDRREHASAAYRKWVREHWRKRLIATRKAYERWSAIPNRAQLLALARCETGGINGGEPLWTHYNSTYAGALGFAHSTWEQFAPASFPRPASRATAEQQLYVGQILVNTFGGYSSWPACSVRLGLR